MHKILFGNEIINSIKIKQVNILNLFVFHIFTYILYTHKHTHTHFERCRFQKYTLVINKVFLCHVKNIYKYKLLIRFNTLFLKLLNS